MKLHWESYGTTYVSAGPSGRQYKIGLAYETTGERRTPIGWLLKEDGKDVHLHASLRQCKKVAKLREKRASLS